MWPELFDRALLPDSLLQLFSAGGPVLYVLALLAILLWGLILERFWFRLHDFPRLLSDCVAADSISDRLCRCSDGLIRLHGSLGLIRTLIALCPLVGLLGTVTGMIQVFDVLALKGTGDARLMAAGVARATLPTMAGMVLAVTGLLSYSSLNRWSGVQKKTLLMMRESR